MDGEELAQRQYIRGLVNRRIAVHMERLDAIFSRGTGDHGMLTLLCACGRDDCEQPPVTLSIDDYERVKESPHRFVICPDHTTEIDETVSAGEGFTIVELKEEYREKRPLTADADCPADDFGTHSPKRQQPGPA
jgi:hypothetical protein